MVTVDGDLCTSASIAVGGLVSPPVKATSVEQALIGQTLPDSPRLSQTLDVENIMAASIQVTDDLGGG